MSQDSGLRAVLIWLATLAVIALPIVVAAASPLLAWRQPVYIAGGLAGVVGLALLLLQPLLVGGYLPGLRAHRGRLVHRIVGAALVSAVVLHVGALWITSPPDVIDALLFRSPTPFSAWGVVAMWAIFATALLAALRKSISLPLRPWRMIHTGLAIFIVIGTVVHAVQIEGTMGQVSKLVLCVAAGAALIKVIVDRRTWTLLSRKTPDRSKERGT